MLIVLCISRYVALKLLTAELSGEYSELQAFHAIADASSASTSAPGRRYVVEFLASYTSANGEHQVLVMSLMRPLHESRFTQIMVKQLVEGLRFLHGHGIIHGGKLLVPISMLY